MNRFSKTESQSNASRFKKLLEICMIYMMHARAFWNGSKLRNLEKFCKCSVSLINLKLLIHHDINWAEEKVFGLVYIFKTWNSWSPASHELPSFYIHKKKKYTVAIWVVSRLFGIVFATFQVQNFTNENERKLLFGHF